MKAGLDIGTGDAAPRSDRQHAGVLHAAVQFVAVNLVLLEPHELDRSRRATLADARAAHLLGVLRVTVGATVRVGVVDGPLGTARVTEIAPPRVDLHCSLDSTRPPIPPVDLLLALPRPKVLRRLWPQLAALGVGRIIVTNAARVERNYFDTHVLEPACYRPLLLEGLQQARDTRLPEVLVRRQFRPLVEDELAPVCRETTCIVADPGADARVGAVLAAPKHRRTMLAIGPEGGWNAFELSLLERHGFQRVGMGPRTLRVDTACVALLALVHDAAPASASMTIARYRPI